MKDPAELLRNLVPGREQIESSVEKGVKALKPHVNDLEAIHILIDYPDPSLWHRKKYCHVHKVELCSRLDEWIYENLIDRDQFSVYLDRYRPKLIAGKIKGLDEYILSRHYRPKAIKALSARKSFNLAAWSKERFRLEYERRSNVWWKSGEEFRFDFRNSIESLFILKQGEDKRVLGVGGGGSSGQRETGTYLTAVFYLLGKTTRIRNFVLRYNGFNEFEYVGRRNRPVLTAGFGSNFNLDKRLEMEIWKKGFYWKVRRDK